MIHLLFVGDGERDAVMLPRLVEKILNVAVREETRNWARLHKQGGSGYGRKLRFATAQARDLGVSGLAALVDTDNDRKHRRLRELREAREAERRRTPAFPTALGQADPHGEAWLLDDAEALRQVLGIPATTSAPTIPHTKNPKKALEALLAQSNRAEDRPLEVWEEIARLVDPSRYQHADETGFEEFAKEVSSELGPITATLGA